MTDVACVTMRPRHECLHALLDPVAQAQQPVGHEALGGRPKELENATTKRIEECNRVAQNLRSAEEAIPLSQHQPCGTSVDSSGCGGQ